MPQNTQKNTQQKGANWQFIRCDKFPWWTVAYRTQGVAYAGEGQLAFSANLALQVTNSEYEVQKGKFWAIPWDLFWEGYRHIGSIAVLGKVVLVPVENRGNGYKNSMIL